MYSIIEWHLSGKRQSGRYVRKRIYVAESGEKIFSAAHSSCIYADTGPGQRTEAFPGCTPAAWLSAVGLLYLSFLIPAPERKQSLRASVT